MWQTIIYYTVLIFEAIIGAFGIRLYEESSYELLARVVGRIEIRRYPPRVAVEVRLPFTGEASQNEAFQLLFAYIAGANSSAISRNGRLGMTVPAKVQGNKRIAMTIPVQSSEAERHVRMQFFLPTNYTINTAPKPRDARVRLVPRETETVASLRFSGSGRDFAAREAELIKSLKGSTWQAVGAPYALFYDAPFTLPFLRRNEAAVAVVLAR